MADRSSKPVPIKGGNNVGRGGARPRMGDQMSRSLPPMKFVPPPAPSVHPGVPQVQPPEIVLPPPSPPVSESYRPPRGAEAANRLGPPLQLQRGGSTQPYPPLSRSLRDCSYAQNLSSSMPTAFHVAEFEALAVAAAEAEAEAASRDERVGSPMDDGGSPMAAGALEISGGGRARPPRGKVSDADLHGAPGMSLPRRSSMSAGENTIFSMLSAANTPSTPEASGIGQKLPQAGAGASAPRSSTKSSIRSGGSGGRRESTADAEDALPFGSISLGPDESPLMDVDDDTEQFSMTDLH